MKFKNWIFETCDYPLVTPLLTQVQAKSAQRLLLVHLCGLEAQNDPHYSDYLSSIANSGAENFAGSNPKLVFAQLHLPSLELAARNGLVPVQRKQFFSELLHSSNDEKSQFDSKLGIQSSIWKPRSRIHEVNAPIEAVEWFRAEADVQPD